MFRVSDGVLTHGAQAPLVAQAVCLLPVSYVYTVRTLLEMT